MLITSYHNKLKKRLFDLIDEAILLFNQIEKPDLTRMKFLDENKIEYFFNFEDEELLEYFNIIGIEFFISVNSEDYFNFSSITSNYWYGRRLVGDIDEIEKYFSYNSFSFNLIIVNYDKEILDFYFFDLLARYNVCNIKLYSLDGLYIRDLKLTEINPYYPLYDEDDYWYMDYLDYLFELECDLADEYDEIYTRKDYHRKKRIEYAKQRRRDRLLKK